jgi:hypothetical protein
VIVLGVLLLLGTLLLAFQSMRWGLMLTLAAGILQDPIRKATEAQSPLWVGLVVVYFAATLSGAYLSGQPSFWRRADWRAIRKAAALFGVILAVQAIFTFARLRIPQLVGIGLAAYLGPMAAVILGFWTGRSPERVRNGMWIYLVLVTFSASGILLSQLGYESRLLATVGDALIVYDPELGAVELPAGFFRTPEVASWHCATACCVALVLAVTRRQSLVRYGFLGAGAAFLVWATLMGGRRKGIGEIIVFVAVYAVLLVWVRGRLGRYGTALLAVVLIGGFAYQKFSGQEQFIGTLGSMQSRSSGEGGWSSRLVANIQAIPYVITYNGFLGRGLGTLTQGGTYYGAEQEWGFANEGGFSKVVGELGGPGAAIFLLLTFRFADNIRKKVRFVRALPLEVANQMLGILALLGANAVVFVSAQQIFGDPFVYLLLGLLAGITVVTVEGAAVLEAKAKEREPVASIVMASA